MDQIFNQAEINYQYRIDPAGPDIEGQQSSNITETDFVNGSLLMNKSVDQEYGTLGDILTYTINVENNGNVDITNIVFNDLVPSGATFVTGSVVVDGVNQPTYDPNTGFPLSDLVVSDTAEVLFQIEVTSLPTPNTLINKATTTFDYVVETTVSGFSESNEVTTTINVANITAVKTANATAVRSGDTLTYNVVITNEGNIDATSVTFTDVVPVELTFVPGSVIIDSVSQPTYDPNIGFNLGTIPSSGVVTVVFETTVN